MRGRKGAQDEQNAERNEPSERRSRSATEIVVVDRTKSGGTVKLVADSSRWAVVKDRGHRLGFVIRIYHERAPEPIRELRTGPGVIWRGAYEAARELLLDPGTLRLIQPPLPAPNAAASERPLSNPNRPS